MLPMVWGVAVEVSLNVLVPETSSVPSLFKPFAVTVHSPMVSPSISTELLSALLEKVFPFGPIPLTVYPVTSSRVLSDGSSVLLPSHDSVDSSSRMVVVPGFSEQERTQILQQMLDRWQQWNDNIVRRAKYLIINDGTYLTHYAEENLSTYSSPSAR